LSFLVGIEKEVRDHDEDNHTNHDADCEDHQTPPRVRC
jgi:hypothetical protein